MKVFTIEVNESSKAGKAFVAFLNAFVKGKKGIKVKEMQEKKSPYNPAFVKMVLDADKGDTVTIDPQNLWESLGLK